MGILIFDEALSNKSGWPHPIAVATLAHMLGFTGATVGEGGIVKEFPSGWMVHVDKAAGVVVVAEPVPGVNPVYAGN